MCVWVCSVSLSTCEDWKALAKPATKPSCAVLHWLESQTEMIRCFNSFSQLKIKINILLLLSPARKITFMQPESHIGAKASFNLQTVWTQMRKRERREDMELP